MNAADENEIHRNLGRIAAALGLPDADAPDYLTNEQIARVAKFAEIANIKNAHTLSSSVERGVRTGDKRWVAYRAVIRKGARRVPATDVARWMAIAAGRLPMPPAATPGNPASAGCASVPGRLWSGLIHHCEG